MSIQVRGKLIKLLGDCPVEEAEPLYEKLRRSKPDAKLDLSGCTGLHTAVLQVLLTCPRAVKREPKEALLAQWVQPLLERAWRDQTEYNPSQESY